MKFPVLSSSGGGDGVDDGGYDDTVLDGDGVGWG